MRTVYLKFQVAMFKVDSRAPARCDGTLGVGHGFREVIPLGWRLDCIDRCEQHLEQLQRLTIDINPLLHCLGCIDVSDIPVCLVRDV